jgi:two-component system sensor kinase FixL
MGELAASIAHEVNQPLGAIVTNAVAAQRYLGHEAIDHDQIRAALEDVAGDARRASEVIRRTRVVRNVARSTRRRCRSTA